MNWLKRLLELATNVEPKNVGRIDYFTFFFLVLLLDSVFGMLFFTFSPYINYSHIGIPLMFVGGVYFTIYFVTVILLILMTNKRLVDAGYSYWNYFWLVLPIVGFFILFFILCKPSIYRIGER